MGRRSPSIRNPKSEIHMTVAPRLDMRCGGQFGERVCVTFFYINHHNGYDTHRHRPKTRHRTPPGARRSSKPEQRAPRRRSRCMAARRQGRGGARRTLLAMANYYGRASTFVSHTHPAQLCVWVDWCQYTVISSKRPGSTWKWGPPPTPFANGNASVVG